MGYTFIDNIRELNVFMTTDSNAIELQTDFETKKLAQLKTYKISDILGYLLIACYWAFTLFKNPVNLETLLTNKGEFYFNSFKLFNMIIDVLFVIQFSLYALSLFVTRLSIAKDFKNHAAMKTYKKIYRVISYIITITIFILIFSQVITSLTPRQLLLFTLVFGVIYIYGTFSKNSFKIGDRNKKIAFNIIAAAIFLSTCFIIEPFNKDKMPEDLKTCRPYSSFKVNYIKERNLFIKQEHIWDGHNHEEIYTAKNEEIAKETFKTYLQRVDRELEYRDVKKLDWGFSDAEKAPFKDYDVTIKRFNKFDVDGIDKCYYLDDNVYMRNKNKFIYTSIEHELDLKSIIDVLK